jgi:Flp pilus assembly protein TadG
MRDERGQITVLTIGFFVFLGLLVVVVVNSSAAFLQHQELDNLADGAALAAADGLSRDDFYRHGVGSHVQIDQAEARRLVASYLGASGERVTVVRISADGDQVHVHIERAVDVAIAPPGWTSRATIVSDATSQLRLSH